MVVRPVAHAVHANPVERGRQHRNAAAGRHQADQGGRLARLLGDVRHEAGRPAQAENLRVDAGADVLRIHHEGLAFQFADGDAGLAGQRMVARQHQHQRVLAQQAQADRVGNGHLRRPHEAQVEGALADRLDLRHRRHLMQGQADQRKALAVAVDDGGEQRRERGREGEADAQLAGLAAFGPARRHGGLLGQRQDAPGVVEEQSARLRQAHPALAALEQLRAQLRLQRLDLLAQRRLADVQALGGAGEVQFLGDGDEIAQVA